MGNWNGELGRTRPICISHYRTPAHDSFSHQCGCEGRGGMRMTAIADEVRRARRGAPARGPRGRGRRAWPGRSGSAPGRRGGASVTRSGAWRAGALGCGWPGYEVRVLIYVTTQVTMTREDGRGCPSRCHAYLRKARHLRPTRRPPAQLPALAEQTVVPAPAPLLAAPSARCTSCPARPRAGAQTAPWPTRR
jgi:hypothetical protein